MNFLPSHIATTAFLALFGPLAAQGDPIRLHGIETAYLLPERTFEFRLGSHQANPPGQKVGTGLQVYEGGASYRGGDWQFGVRFSSYDDMPAGPIDGGAFGHLSLIGLGLDVKRQLLSTDNLAWAIAASIEGLSFGSRLPYDDSTDHLSGSIHAPITFRLSPSLQAHLDPSIVKLPNQLKGGDGFGTNAFLGTALSWQAASRVMAYAEVEAPLFGRGNTFDTNGDIAKALAWSLGARIRIAPAADLDLYVSNRVAGTPASSGLVLPPMGEVPMFGAQILYQPGRRDSSFKSAPLEAARPFDGFLVRSAAVLFPGSLSLESGYGSSGSRLQSITVSMDEGLEFDGLLERQLNAASDYDTPPGTDPLFMLGGRLQVLYPSLRAPVWGSAGILAGRTLDFETRPWDPGRPTVGFIYGDVSVSRQIEKTLTLTMQARATAWRQEFMAGFGGGVVYRLTDSLDAVAEASVNQIGPLVWASGLRWQVSDRTSASIFGTNAIGDHGHGSMMASDRPQLQLKIVKSFNLPKIFQINN